MDSRVKDVQAIHEAGIFGENRRTCVLKGAMRLAHLFTLQGFLGAVCA